MQSDLTPLHDVSTIETPEQIELNLPLAGVGSRAVAFFIDLLWQLVPLVAAGFLLFALLPQGTRPGSFVEIGDNGQATLTRGAQAFLSIITFVINFGYFAFFEIIWKGQSPGKRAIGIRVVRDGGYPIDGRAALVRNFLRVVDLLPTFYFLGMATLFLGRQGKRVGDYAAGTIVIKERPTSASLGVDASI